MMANIVSVGTSVPAQGSGSLNRPVTTTPINLAEFGLDIPQGANRVILNATVGVTSALLAPVLIFNVFRGDQVIFSSREEGLLSAGQELTISFQAIDTNVPATASQRYLVTVQLESAFTAANVTGPVTFSGVSYTFP
ncbi:exosporium protein C (plasmid) [Peribacillus frigoritolerans]|uniref:exosporium protein C n=1 Tax=Peribacillus frigoritolerans TaxID=450367 RepID=UPI001EFDB763|nr:exosporium protein C [Peribacillus frigoritolerans]ULM99899.1 exosporium protein C [Peribacillus frigoritolerans]